MARRPIWLWPNLLSLDAPLVAVAWFWVFKQVWLVKSHQPSLPWFLALVVWCIYVADRLLDARMEQTGARRMSSRHEFHRRYHKPLTLALLLGLLGAMALLALQARGLIIHGMFVLVPVVGYFVISLFDSGRGVSYFKNLLAGLAFAYGTAVGVHLHGRESHNVLNLIVSPEVIAFAVLCTLNMSAIDHWEDPWEGQENEKEAFETVLTVLLVLLAAFALLMAVRSERLGLDTQKAFFIAIMVGAAALQTVNRLKERTSTDALRVLADVAMLLPLPVFYGMIVYAESA